MPELPSWAISILTVTLRRWVHEHDGGTIADAADYFGVSPEDIKIAIRLTGALDTQHRGGVECIIASPPPTHGNA